MKHLFYQQIAAYILSVLKKQRKLNLGEKQQ